MSTWPPLDADGPVVAEARRILRDTSKQGHYWTTSQWRAFVDGLIGKHGLTGQPTSEAGMAKLGPELNAHGAAPQRGSEGRWSGRIYMPAPPPATQDASDHDSYWWDFMRFVDITPHPWGSSSWVWEVRQDPGPPPQTETQPSPRPPTEPNPPDPQVPPPTPPSDVENEVRSLRDDVQALRDRIDWLEGQLPVGVGPGHPVEVSGSISMRDALVGNRVTWRGKIL